MDDASMNRQEAGPSSSPLSRVTWNARVMRVAMMLPMASVAMVVVSRLNVVLGASLEPGRVVVWLTVSGADGGGVG